MGSNFTTVGEKGEKKESLALGEKLAARLKMVAFVSRVSPFRSDLGKPR